MIQLNLTVKQALAVYALLGETTSGCIYLNQVEEYLKDSLSEDNRQHVWDDLVDSLREGYRDQGLAVTCLQWQ